MSRASKRRGRRERTHTAGADAERELRGPEGEASGEPGEGASEGEELAEAVRMVMEALEGLMKGEAGGGVNKGEGGALGGDGGLGAVLAGLLTVGSGILQLVNELAGEKGKEGKHEKGEGRRGDAGEGVSGGTVKKGPWEGLEGGAPGSGDGGWGIGGSGSTWEMPAPPSAPPNILMPKEGDGIWKYLGVKAGGEGTGVTAGDGETSVTGEVRRDGEWLEEYLKLSRGVANTGEETRKAVEWRRDEGITGGNQGGGAGAAGPANAGRAADVAGQLGSVDGMREVTESVRAMHQDVVREIRRLPRGQDATRFTQ